MRATRVWGGVVSWLVLIWLVLWVATGLFFGMDGVSEWFFGAVVTAGGLFVFASIVGGFYAWRQYETFEREHPCLRAHKETIHVPASTIYVRAGKVFIPIMTPARDEPKIVCDERQGLTR